MKRRQCLLQGLMLLACQSTAWHGAEAADQLFVPADANERLVAPGLFKDTRIVAYEYDPNRTYPVKARVNVYTEIAVPDDERIVAWYPSADDKKGWPYTVSGDRRHVFIMPMQAGTVNTATLITDKRSYLLTFEAVSDGTWFQRVRWIVPEETVSALPTQYEAQQEDPAAEATSPDGPDLENMFVKYDIHGDAAFAPTLVADDGKFTWFRLAPNVQELPALFVLNSKGDPELVNYTVDQSDLIKAQRTSNAWLLKLGDDEVRVTVKSAKSGSWFGWFN